MVMGSIYRGSMVNKPWSCVGEIPWMNGGRVRCWKRVLGFARGGSIRDGIG